MWKPKGFSRNHIGETSGENESTFLFVVFLIELGKDTIFLLRVTILKEKRALEIMEPRKLIPDKRRPKMNGNLVLW